MDHHIALLNYRATLLFGSGKSPTQLFLKWKVHRMFGGFELMVDSDFILIKVDM
jgi:hypothetical protein